MINYILAAFFTAAAVLTLAGNVEVSELMVALIFITLAALIIAAQHTEDKAREEAKTRHPSYKPKKQETEAYDWFKDQTTYTGEENTEE